MGILHILIVACLTIRVGLFVTAPETTTKMVKIIFIMHWTISVVQSTYLYIEQTTGQSCLLQSTKPVWAISLVFGCQMLAHVFAGAKSVNSKAQRKDGERSHKNN